MPICDNKPQKVYGNIVMESFWLKQFEENEKQINTTCADRLLRRAMFFDIVNFVKICKKFIYRTFCKL